MPMKRDPKVYREMSVPHANAEAAEAAADAFFDDLYTLRVKHKIADVHVIIQTPIITGDGSEGNVMMSSYIGNEREELGMVAAVYRSVKAKYLDMFAKVEGSSRR